MLAALGHENLSWRLQAQRLLVERNETEIVPELLRIASSDENEAAALHALWTLAGMRDRSQVGSTGLDARLRDVCVARLKSANPALRRAALKLLPPSASQLQRQQERRIAIEKAKIRGHDADHFVRDAVDDDAPPLPRNRIQTVRCAR